MTDKQYDRLANIELRLAKYWVQTNNTQWDFKPTGVVGEIGDLEIANSTKLTKTNIQYKVEIENDDPYLILINKNEILHKFEILDIADKELSVKNIKTGEQLDFHP